MTSTQLPDKWIAGINAHASVAETAQHVLSRRVGAAASILKAVAKCKGISGDADEHIHQLRVATRRAQSALLSFKPWLRRERRRATNKALRRIRAAAGEVRMCDVHRRLLLQRTDVSADNSRTAIEVALIMLGHDRHNAMVNLHRLTRRESIRRVLHTRNERWARHARARDADPVSAAVDSVTPEATIHEAGDRALQSLAQSVLDAAQSGLESREHLHALRLCCKRLRYAIEIFGATSSNMETLALLSAMLTVVQERLGAVNDAHEVGERLSRYAAKLRADLNESPHAGDSIDSAIAPKLQTLANECESQCVQLAAEFQAWWQGLDAMEFRNGLERIAAMSPAPPEAPTVEIVVLPNGQPTCTSTPETAHVHSQAGEA